MKVANPDKALVCFEEDELPKDYDLVDAEKAEMGLRRFLEEKSSIVVVGLEQEEEIIEEIVTPFEVSIDEIEEELASGGANFKSQVEIAIVVEDEKLPVLKTSSLSYNKENSNSKLSSLS